MFLKMNTDTGLTCRTEDTEEAFFVHLSGDLDLTNLSDLEDVLRVSLASGRDLVVNFRDLHSIDSAGLGTLLVYRERAETLGRRIVVAEPSAFIQRVIELMGFSQVVPSFGSIEEALASLRASSESPPPTPHTTGPS